jgi:crotonobetainyl-CoA:carnitine CoA-transferase CaiB-like acyl-CoA transferase
MADPVHIARGLSILRDHPGLGRICNVGRSRRFSRTPVDPLFAAPLIGCDSRAIVDETGWGACFSQLIADGDCRREIACRDAAGRQQRPAEVMAAR